MLLTLKQPCTLSAFKTRLLTKRKSLYGANKSLWLCGSPESLKVPYDGKNKKKIKILLQEHLCSLSTKPSKPIKSHFQKHTVLYLTVGLVMSQRAPKYAQFFSNRLLTGGDHVSDELICCFFGEGFFFD